jgi:hypothetical protein
METAGRQDERECECEAPEEGDGLLLFRALLLGSGDGVFESLAGGEGRDTARRDFDFRARLGIAAFARFTIAHKEAAEGDQLHLIAALQRRLDLLEHQVEDLAAQALGEFEFVRDGVDKIGFGQETAPQKQNG